MLNMIFQN